MEAELAALTEQIELFFGIIQLLTLLIIPIIVLSLIIALTTGRKYRSLEEEKETDYAMNQDQASLPDMKTDNEKRHHAGAGCRSSGRHRVRLR